MKRGLCPRPPPVNSNQVHSFSKSLEIKYARKSWYAVDARCCPIMQCTKEIEKLITAGKHLKQA